MNHLMNRPFVAPIGFTLFGLVSIVAYLFVSPSKSSELIAASAPVFAAIAVMVSVLVFRPVRPVPWLLYAVGVGMLGLAPLVRAAEWYGETGVGFPSGFEAVTALAYPSLFVATISITSGRRHARDLLAGSEPIIYAIALTALVWLGVTGPYVDESTMRLTPDAWVWTFPLLDGVLATLALRRTDRSDPARSVFQVMALGFLLLGAAHAATGWASSEGELVLGSPLAATLMIGPLLLGFVATLPSLRTLVVATGDPFRVHWSQILGLLFAALVPLAALMLMLAIGLSSTSSFVVVSLATVSVVVLALARMWRLVDQVRLLTEQRGHARLAAMVEHSSDVVMLGRRSGTGQLRQPGVCGRRSDTTRRAGPAVTWSTSSSTTNATTHCASSTDWSKRAMAAPSSSRRVCSTPTGSTARPTSSSPTSSAALRSTASWPPSAMSPNSATSSVS